MDIPIKKKPPVVRYKYYIIAGALFAGLLIYLLATSVGGTKLRYDSENLQVAEITQGKFLDYLDVEGIANPKLTIKVNSLEAGTVERIVADDGASLTKGDTILILSNPELVRVIGDEQDDLEKQRISHEEKSLQMKRKSSELRRTTMKTVYDLERLKKQYHLDKEEFEIGIKSKAQLDVASDDYNFNQKNATILLEELEHDSLMNVIQTDLMQNDLKREEKRFGRSKDRLDNLIVRAPMDGQLSFISVIPGERVGAGSNIGELKTIEEIKLSTKVSEYYIDRISLGLPATITYQNEKYPLKISKINPEISDRQFAVDLVFIDKKPDNIRIGKSYRLQIELGQPEDALIVDKGNFYQSTGGQWVFKLNEAGNKAVRVPITIGRQNPKQYEIIEGLQAGDKIVISGYDNFGEAQELILK
ncbi:MAG: efflux RND transporter periplasmic adaptor subunit [Prevotella sp.]|jgi:HlyD family secretion protein|nr:efflux RND transporter periplasmic adaptor subunit [Prevotella sp.]